ncbi:MAG TPA: ABC transporter permease, partial [Thermoanaerobaculia bacterium]|nr:ABC transporter permease [Thermoanaerobaculia bacterium]
GGTKVNGQYVDVLMDDVTDDYAKAMRMQVVRGRWFSSADDAAPFRAGVVDENAAKKVFGDQDPIGKKIDVGEDTGEIRIVGVVREYRKDGETMSASSMLFRRLAPDHKFGGLMRNIVVRVRPGTPADFEQTLVDRLQAVAPDMSFRVRHMDQMRRDFNSFRLAPIILGAIVAAFLISMVALGLTGVLWQNVTRRTREIGLRRAVGAAGSAVHRQILAEVVLLATFALIVGSIVVLQLPLLGAFTLVTPASFTAGFLGALATIYGLTVLCGLYPSWLASRLQPADALRYE